MVGISVSLGEVDVTTADKSSVSPGSADLGDAIISVTVMGETGVLSMGDPPSSSLPHEPNNAPRAASTPAHTSQFRFGRSIVFKCKPPLTDRASMNSAEGLARFYTLMGKHSGWGKPTATISGRRVRFKG